MITSDLISYFTVSLETSTWAELNQLLCEGFVHEQLLPDGEKKTLSCFGKIEGLMVKEGKHLIHSVEICSQKICGSDLQLFVENFSVMEQEEKYKTEEK